MRGIMMIVLAAFAQAHDTDPAGDQTADSQDSVDKFANELADELINRALKTWSFENADLDDSTLAKPASALSQARPVASLHPGLPTPFRTVSQTPGLLSSRSLLNVRDKDRASLVPHGLPPKLRDGWTKGRSKTKQAQERADQRRLRRKKMMAKQAWIQDYKASLTPPAPGEGLQIKIIDKPNWYELKEQTGILGPDRASLK